MEQLEPWQTPTLAAPTSGSCRGFTPPPGFRPPPPPPICWSGTEVKPGGVAVAQGHRQRVVAEHPHLVRADFGRDAADVEELLPRELVHAARVAAVGSSEVVPVLWTARGVG